MKMKVIFAGEVITSETNQQYLCDGFYEWIKFSKDKDVLKSICSYV